MGMNSLGKLTKSGHSALKNGLKYMDLMKQPRCIQQVILHLIQPQSVHGDFVPNNFVPATFVPQFYSLTFLLPAILLLAFLFPDNFVPGHFCS